MLSERAAALSLMPAGTLSLMQQPFHSDNCSIICCYCISLLRMHATAQIICPLRITSRYPVPS